MTQGIYKKRILTALVLIVLIAIAAYLGGLYFLLLMGAISVVAGTELHCLFVPCGLNVRREFLLIPVLLILAGAYKGVEYFLAAFYAASVWVFVVHIVRGRKDISGYVRETGMSLVFITLLGTLTGAAVLLRNIETEMSVDWSTGLFLKNEPGFFFVAMAFICAALNDSAAYFVGKWKGRTKFIPNISPGKTIEGAIAGIAVATVAGFFVNTVFSSPLSTPLALFLGLLAGLSSVAGDLMESAVKRNGNAKDSGAILPGHGGFFDRFDGMIFVFPAFYVFVVFL